MVTRKYAEVKESIRILDEKLSTLNSYKLFVLNSYNLAERGRVKIQLASF